MYPYDLFWDITLYDLLLGAGVVCAIFILRYFAMLNMTEYVKMTFKTLTSLYEKLLELHKEKNEKICYLRELLHLG